MLALGGLAMVGGTAIGGQAGPFTAVYGVLLTACAFYLIAVLALRDRSRRESSSSGVTETRHLGGLRIF